MGWVWAYAGGGGLPDRDQIATHARRGAKLTDPTLGFDSPRLHSTTLRGSTYQPRSACITDQSISICASATPSISEWVVTRVLFFVSGDFVQAGLPSVTSLPDCARLARSSGGFCHLSRPWCRGTTCDPEGECSHVPLAFSSLERDGRGRRGRWCRVFVACGADHGVGPSFGSRGGPPERVTRDRIRPGRLRHGHAHDAGPGDLQWMTAGRGIVHCEMPVSKEPCTGLQLWVNLVLSPPFSLFLRFSFTPSFCLHHINLLAFFLHVCSLEEEG